MPLNNAHHFVMEGVTLTEIHNNIIQRRKALSPVRKTPPSTSQNFTGQEEYLQALHNHFKTNDDSCRKMYLLYGMGGIGKTQICLKFKDDICDNYTHIFWVDATSDDTIEQSLKDIYKTNSARTAQGNVFSSALVLQWISVLKDRWMIIYDNADGTPSVVQEFLPPGNKGHILISSRNPEHKTVVSARNSVEVNVMHKTTAIELLLKASGLQDEADKYFNSVSEICSTLHFLPLAIDQAGAYINAGKCSIDRYVYIYSKYSSILMDNKSFKGASKYNKTVYGTWEISFRKIRDMAHDKHNEEQAMAAQYAISLLNMCAFMHHDNISDEIFERAARHYYSHCVVDYDEELPLPKYIPTMDKSILNLAQSNDEWNEMQYRESIGILVSFSLIKRTVDGAKFSLHPLIQKWCKDRLRIDEKQKWMQDARAVLVVSVTNNQTSAEYMYLNALLLHITQNLSNENLESMTYYHDIFQLLEKLLFANGKYNVHHIICAKIFQRLRESYGDNHIKTLGSKSALAISYSKIGNFAEAERLQVQIFNTRSQLLGTEHPDTLTSMANLADTYWRLGMLTEAERVGLQAFELRCKILGIESPDTFSSMENLGDIYTESGNYIEAEKLRIQCLDMRQRILGTEHPDTLMSMADLAITYNQLGKHSKAEELNKQVLEMRGKNLGTEHPDTFTSMENLAVTYYSLEKYSDAERLEVQVLKMRSRTLGTEHPDTIKSMSNLAVMYSHLRKYTEAQRLEVQVLEIRRKILGTEHPDTLLSMAKLAVSYYDDGNYVEAERLEVLLLEMGGRILGSAHPYTLILMENLAITYKALGKFSEATELEMQLADIQSGTESRG